MESQVELLDREQLANRVEEFLELERYWTDVGETVWNRDSLFKELPKKFDLSVFAQIEGKVVGYLVGSEIKEGVGKINKILTHGKYRGCGIATGLWRKFLNNCRNNGFSKLEFRVLNDNYDAISFYKHKGNLFHGETIGTDKRTRYDIHYIFNAVERIPHSRPTTDESDVIAITAPIKERFLSSGRRTEELVSVMCNYSGKKYGVAANSGSNAIFLALKALGAEGKEVILPSYLCGSVLHGIENANSMPVFADIDMDFNLSPEDVRKKINASTKAIIVPHMFGKVAQGLEEIAGFGIPVIEDCAQALGAKYRGSNIGASGDVSVFSFYPTKMLASAGGGIALTDDETLFMRMKDMAMNDNRPQWGEAYSMGMSDVSSAVVLNQFRSLGSFIQRRNEIAKMYGKFLDIPGITLPQSESGDIFFRYALRHEDADSVLDSLNRRGIDARRPVYSPLHRYHNISDSEFPGTVDAYRQAVSLPIYPSLSDKQVIEVAGAVLNWREEK